MKARAVWRLSKNQYDGLVEGHEVSHFGESQPQMYENDCVMVNDGSHRTPLKAKVLRMKKDNGRSNIYVLKIIQAA